LLAATTATDLERTEADFVRPSAPEEALRPVTPPVGQPAPTTTEAFQGVAEANQRLVEAQGLAAAAVEQGAVDKLATIAENEAALAEQQRQAQAAEAERQDALNRQFQRLDEAQQAVANFKFVDPWDEKSTGSKIAAAIGLVLGGIGAGLTGGPNQALTVMKAAINSDIARQKAEFDKAQGGLRGQLTLIGQMRQRFTDERQAEAATRLTMLDEARRRVEAIEIQTTAPAARAQLEIFKGELEKERAEQMAAFAGKAALQAQKTQIARQQQRGPVVTAETRPDDLTEKQKARLVFSEDGRPLGLAVDDTSARRVRERVAQAKDIRAKIARIRELREKHGSEILNRRAVAEANALASSVVTTMNEIKGLGALAGADIDILTAEVPLEPLATFTTTAGVLGKLDQATQNLDSFMASLFAAQGLQQEAPQPKTFKPR
jgi:hypothetical protein